MLASDIPVVPREDLIDTLWNVKQSLAQGIREGQYGFNRYILECKAARRDHAAAGCRRFNRYIVECKVKNSEALPEMQEAI